MIASAAVRVIHDTIPQFLTYPPAYPDHTNALAFHSLPPPASTPIGAPLPFKMFKARDTKRAIQTLKHSRTFSSTPARPAISPYRRTTQAAPTKALKDSSKRPQSTAAAATQEPRSRSAPTFNRDDWNDMQPLKPYRQPEMDHSFVGMKGGEIFHEMMLRQGVKHICAFSAQLLFTVFVRFSNLLTITQLDTLEEPFCPYSTPSTNPHTSTSSYRDMSRALDIWRKAMHVHPARLALFSSPLDPAPPTS